jgi:hypothetical protein
MIGFQQFCLDERALLSLGEIGAKRQAIAEHKHIIFNTRTPVEILAYEVNIMNKKARSLQESLIANKAFESHKLQGAFNDTKTASALMFNVFNELNRLNEIVAGDADGDADKIASGETSGAVVYSAETIKKKLRKKAVKNLKEQNAPSSAYEIEPTISNVLVEREALKLSMIAMLVKAVKRTETSVKELHKTLKPNPSKNQAVLSKLRRAKANGNDHELLQIIAGVLGFGISNKVTDVTVKGKGRSKKDKR